MISWILFQNKNRVKCKQDRVSFYQLRQLNKTLIETANNYFLLFDKRDLKKGQLARPLARHR
ncbi:hypothetical protein BpHYR1_048915 [Brachionus plicatilis]|uniref:Uncharacterized protein n=1 Tax=Brachionus plicatilis TaxID=10195 RepID=A0A3M7S1K2_BRAPC|nr:hypothetical protein BpHYR1_048915 [Brachionus plicatilis]